MRDQISNKLNEIELLNNQLELRNKKINEQFDSFTQSEKEEYQKYENYLKKNKVEYEITKCNIRQLNFGKTLLTQQII
jgi:hypothetical protein